MPLDIAAIGANAANSAIGAGMGLLLGAHNDRRQIKQQQKLQDMQVAGQKQMIDFSQQKQYEMWEKTNYGPQMDQLKKAGLNPGLLYGMGGGGGATTGNASGNVSGGNAPTGGGEAQAMGIAMMQAQLMKAQKENIQADTENKKAQNPNYATEGENIKTRTGNIAADTKGKELQNEYLKESMGDRLQGISAQAVQEIQKAQQMVNDTTVSDATVQDRIIQIKQNAIGQILSNTLAKIEQTVKGVNIEKARAELKAIAEYVEQGWRKVGQGERQTQQGWDKINVDKNRNEIMERLGNAGLDLQDRGQILQTITGVMGMGANLMPQHNTSSNEWWQTNADGSQTSGGSYNSTKNKR